MKLSRFLWIAFYCIYGISFTWIYLYGIGKAHISFPGIIITMICLSIAGILLSRKLHSLSDHSFGQLLKWSKRGIPFIFIFQVLFVFAFRTENLWGWDFDTIIYLAKCWVINDTTASYAYLAQFENNVLYFLLVLLIFYITYFFTGQCSVIPLLILNILILDLCLWGIYKLTLLLSTQKQAFLTLLLCLSFTPYWMYLPIAYTDIFSMPFFVFILLFAVQYQQKQSIPLLIGIGALGAIGYYFKGTPIIAVIAATIYLIFALPNIKSKARSLLCIIPVFLITALLVGCFINKLPFYSDEERNLYKYPVTHWIYMGLVDNGRWNANVVGMTNACPDYNTKREFTVSAIKETLSDYGAEGVFWHVTQKEALVMFNKGTLNAEICVLRTPVHERFVSSMLDSDSVFNSIYQYYSQGYFRLLLLLFIFGIAIRLKKFFTPPIVLHPIDLLYLTAFGVFLFYAFWEVDSRYLLNNVFIFIITTGNILYSFITAKERI